MLRRSKLEASIVVEAVVDDNTFSSDTIDVAVPIAPSNTVGSMFEELFNEDSNGFFDDVLLHSVEASDALQRSTMIDNVDESSLLMANLKIELNQYRLHPSIAITDDPLLWWKLNEIKYPNIARVARKILAIPATSASSERVFSTAGQVLSILRSRLSPGTVEDLVFMNGYYKFVESFSCPEDFEYDFFPAFDA